MTPKREKVRQEELQPTILVVDDESSVRESFKILLGDDYRILTATNGEEAIRNVKEKHFNLVLLDVRMPGMDGIEALRRIKEMDERLDVIMVTAVKTVRTAVEAMKLGAYDYINKPFDVDEVVAIVRRVMQKQDLQKEVAYLRSEVERQSKFHNLIGSSPAMQPVFETISEMAKSDATVLITGETGTGKEQVARAIHFNSQRSDKPFIAVDCAALPETLIESELFGHEKGAFTGATMQRLGKFELANRGTLFLDEIGNLRLDMQAKILRALQEREIQRVGGIKTIKVDIRIISATNIDLMRGVKEQRFREDLYYRLNVVPLHVPPLRERREDIPILVKHFLERYNQEFNKSIKGVSEKAQRYLMSYNWPGNVRELQNVIERLTALGKEEIIPHDRLPLDILLVGEEAGLGIRSEGLLLKEARDGFEREFILSALEKTGWNQIRTSRILGVHRNTLSLKMRELNLKHKSICTAQKRQQMKRNTIR
ncbi:sigma-54-dependent Fis family transcriptional regulator [bacterium]|nr:sigma-54-dependent Fis family transcriptional regulator [bacterium]